MDQAAKNNAALMAELFDVEIGPNLDVDIPSDYGESNSTNTNVPFDVKCSTIVNTMVPDADSGTYAVPTEKSTMSNSDNKTESAKKTVASTKKNAKTKVAEPKTEEVVKEVSNDVQAVVASNKSNAVSNTAIASCDINLILPPAILALYNSLILQHPQFRIHVSDQSFNDFYVRKVQIVSNLVGRFPILNIAQMRQEIRTTDLNHNLGESEISPDSIAQRLDDTYKCRTRVVYLLSETHAQYHVWRKCSDMLASKLWSDHESRGAHKRESLVLEHMPEIAMYVEEMEGFIQSATAIDGLLRAAADSLSRQLSCIQIKHSSGLIGTSGHKIVPSKRNVAYDMDQSVPGHMPQSVIDTLDGIDDGSIVDKGIKVGPIVHTWQHGSTDDNDPMLNIC